MLPSSVGDDSSWYIHFFSVLSPRGFISGGETEAQVQNCSPPARFWKPLANLEPQSNREPEPKRALEMSCSVWGNTKWCQDTSKKYGTIESERKEDISVVYRDWRFRYWRWGEGVGWILAHKLAELSLWSRNGMELKIRNRGEGRSGSRLGSFPGERNWDWDGKQQLLRCPYQDFCSRCLVATSVTPRRWGFWGPRHHLRGFLGGSVG